MRFVKYFSIILIMILSSISLTGCYDKREIDDLTYAIAVGFEKGSANALRLTIQYVVPNAIGGSSGGGGGDSKPLSTITVDTPTVFSGLNMINSAVGKQLNLSHAVAVIFSEDIAKSDYMYNYIHALVRGREFRPNMYIAVSRNSPEEFLKSVKPIQESDPAKFYELKFSSNQFSGFIASTQLYKFYNEQESPSIQPVAVLVGTNKNKRSEDFNNLNSTNISKGRFYPLEGDYKAGDNPITSDTPVETMGLAVFDGKKMLGELDGQETTYFLMLTGEYKNSNMTFTDPKEKSSYVVLSLLQARKPEFSVDTSTDKPKINIKLKLEGDILSIQSGQNYEATGQRELLEKSVEEFLSKEISSFVDKTTKEFGSDICGFGRYARKNFQTLSQLNDYKWLEKYKNGNFDINIDFKIRRPGLIIRSIPAQSSGGEGF